MTRKDYIGIAQAIRDTRERIRVEAETLIEVRRTDYGGGFQQSQKNAIEHSRDVQLRGVRGAAARIAEFLMEDNPRFDVRRFLTACGYGTTLIAELEPTRGPLPGERD
jgi:hypothetical protein